MAGNSPSPLAGTNPVHALVLGDFGRDAGIRFCRRLADLERSSIQGRLQPAEPFFDEYRRMALTLVGDLAFTKAPWLPAGEMSGRLDERVLVGFPGGPTIGQIAPRLLALALEAMAGPLARGAEEMLLLLPCNTLAPVSWALRAHLASAEAAGEVLTANGIAPTPAQRVALEAWPTGLRLSIPTVPEAVLARARTDGNDLVLPLGTADIHNVYRDAASRLGSNLEVIDPLPRWQEAAREAITAAIAGGDAREAGKRALESVAGEAAETYGERLLLVEACTDLDYGVGCDSNARYAESVIASIYD